MDAREFLKVIKSDNPSIVKLAKVVDLFPDGAGKIQIDGEEAVSQKKYPRLASYTAQINDRVLLIVISGTYVILGKIV